MRIGAVRSPPRLIRTGGRLATAPEIWKKALRLDSSREQLSVCAIVLVSAMTPKAIATVISCTCSTAALLPLPSVHTARSMIRRKPLSSLGNSPARRLTLLDSSRLPLLRSILRRSMLRSSSLSKKSFMARLQRRKGLKMLFFRSCRFRQKFWHTSRPSNCFSARESPCEAPSYFLFS